MDNSKNNIAWNTLFEKLEKLLEAFIKEEVDFKGLEPDDYDKYKDDPYVQLIYGIYNSADINSDFRKKLEELKKEKEDKEKQLKDLE